MIIYENMKAPIGNCDMRISMPYGAFSDYFWCPRYPAANDNAPEGWMATITRMNNTMGIRARNLDRAMRLIAETNEMLKKMEELL
jgi:hypothetical protein